MWEYLLWMIPVFIWMFCRMLLLRGSPVGLRKTKSCSSPVGHPCSDHMRTVGTVVCIVVGAGSHQVNVSRCGCGHAPRGPRVGVVVSRGLGRQGPLTRHTRRDTSEPIVEVGERLQHCILEFEQAGDFMLQLLETKYVWSQSMYVVRIVFS